MTNLTKEDIEAFTTSTSAIGSELKQFNNKFNNRVLGALILCMLLSLVTTGATLALVAQGHSTDSRIKDCLVPNGTCSQRTAATTGQIVFSAAYRSETERIATELPVAIAKNDVIRAEVLDRRYLELQGYLAKVNENLHEIQSNRPPKHQIPIPTTTIVP
jgi:hypothetical protein